MKRVTAIARKTLRMILEASRDMYPREFGAILRAEEGTITELILVPGTVSGKRHAIFQLHTLPADSSVVGTVHSHPSGVYEPSDEDLAPFNKFVGFHGLQSLHGHNTEPLPAQRARKHAPGAVSVDFAEVIVEHAPRAAGTRRGVERRGEPCHGDQQGTVPGDQELRVGHIARGFG